MLRRCACFWVLLWSAGCQSFPLGGTPPARVAAERLWADGQAAMHDGEQDAAIRHYQQSAAADPRRARTWLSLAAAELDKGDEEAACAHLAQYVAARPADLKVRAYYAELLLRVQKIPAARAEFERFDADAQEQGQLTGKQLVHCHSRLSKIAAACDDEYAEHLHRGIGLYLLGLARAKLPDPDRELCTEGLLCKAATELAEAQACRPEEARPAWYLHEVWSHLGQRQPARRWLDAAADAAPFTYLTPAEKRSLRLTAQQPELPRN